MKDHADRPFVVERFGVPVVMSWPGIAGQLGLSVRTVIRYSQVEIDPLPVQRDKVSGHVWIRLSELEEWAVARGLWGRGA